MYNYYMSREELKRLPERQLHEISRNNIRTAGIYDLAAIGQKSFNGRAKVIITDNGKYLMSYSTLVLYISNAGDVVRLWGDWSTTTAKHINSFLAQNGIQAINKSEWLKMPVGLPARITRGA